MGNKQSRTSKTNNTSTHNQTVAKILMLGPGSCGKTSIFKQAKFMFGQSPTFDNEVNNCVNSIKENILTTIAQLSTYCIQHNIPFETEENEKAAKKIIQIESSTFSYTQYTSEIANQCKKLWNDKNIQKHFLDAYRLQHIGDGVFQYVFVRVLTLKSI
jgi:hypothetical protein